MQGRNESGEVRLHGTVALSILLFLPSPDEDDRVTDKVTGWLEVVDRRQLDVDLGGNGHARWVMLVWSDKKGTILKHAVPGCKVLGVTGHPPETKMGVAQGIHVRRAGQLMWEVHPPVGEMGEVTADMVREAARQCSDVRETIAWPGRMAQAMNELRSNGR